MTKEDINILKIKSIVIHTHTEPAGQHCLKGKFSKTLRNN